VSSPTAHARVTLRGRTHRLPFSEEMQAGAQPEIVEVTAPGHEGRSFWVKLDRPVTLAASLPEGRGVAEASAEETVIALGGTPIDGEAADDEAAAEGDKPAPGHHAGAHRRAATAKPAPAS